MYLITNREIISKNSGLKIFGDRPNPKGSGAQEITLVNVQKKGNSYTAKPVTDELSIDVVKELKKKYKIDIDVRKKWHGSLKVACEIFEKARSEKKSILIFVHGYNNDVADVVKAAEAIEELYNVIVVPFTWPANGGGIVSGTASYLSDKADARQSSGALNRVVAKIRNYHLMLTRANVEKLRQKALDKFPDNSASANALFTKLQQKDCQSKLSLLCHSMGNYVFKHTLMTSDRYTDKLVFDNICLVAADANNKDHKLWVSKLDVRNRCYIVINENDMALSASRIKPGEEQRARLGHYTRKLDASNAYYIDLTDAKDVDTEHTYFKGDTVKNNQDVKNLFDRMFNGQSVEKALTYLSDKNTYVLELPEEEDVF